MLIYENKTLQIPGKYHKVSNAAKHKNWGNLLIHSP